MVQAISIPAHTPWPLLVAMPAASLSTKTARALLPGTYSKADAVANVQAVALLTAAFATGRGDLLATSMADRLHQPYRAAVCPLLPALLPLAGHDGVLGVALSGAGPSVLLLLDPAANPLAIQTKVETLASAQQVPVHCLMTRIGTAATLGPSVV